MRPFLSPHRRWRRLLEKSESGSLSGRELEWFEEHRRTCERCAREAAELALVRELLAELPEVEPPRSFRLGGAVVAAPSAPRTWTWASRALVGVATAAAVTFGVFLALAVREPSPPQAEPAPVSGAAGSADAQATAPPRAAGAPGLHGQSTAAAPQASPEAAGGGSTEPESAVVAGEEEAPDVSAAGEMTPAESGYVGPEGRLATPPAAITTGPPLTAPTATGEPSGQAEERPGIASTSEEPPAQPEVLGRTEPEPRRPVDTTYLAVAIGSALLALAAGGGAVILRRMR